MTVSAIASLPTFAPADEEGERAAIRSAGGRVAARDA